MIHTLSIMRSPRKQESRTAFTVIEILIAVGLMAILGTMTLSVMRGARRSGAMVKEVNAGKMLISAYLNYATEHNGRLMVAHYEGANPEIDNTTLTLPSGEILTGGALHRYPFRLSAYFNYQIDGVLLVNQNKQVVPELFVGNELSYGISLCPSFGINYYFAGGHMVDGAIANPDEVLTRTVQSQKPSHMLIFATAATNATAKRVEGRFGVEPPSYKTDIWKDDLAKSNIDPRHNGKALCVFLDGSVRQYAVSDLSSDMRYWSFKAQANDDPNYRVPVQGSTGIGGGGRR